MKRIREVLNKARQILELMIGMAVVIAALLCATVDRIAMTGFNLLAVFTTVFTAMGFSLRERRYAWP